MSPNPNTNPNPNPNFNPNTEGNFPWGQLSGYQFYGGIDNLKTDALPSGICFFKNDCCFILYTMNQSLYNGGKVVAKKLLIFLAK